MVSLTREVNVIREPLIETKEKTIVLGDTALMKDVGKSSFKRRKESESYCLTAFGCPFLFLEIIQHWIRNL